MPFQNCIFYGTAEHQKVLNTESIKMELAKFCFICNNSLVTTGTDWPEHQEDEKLLKFVCNFFKVPVNLSGIPDSEFCGICQAKLNGALRKLDEIRSLEIECEQIKTDLWRTIVSSYKSFETKSPSEGATNPVVSAKTESLSSPAVRKTLVQCLSQCKVKLERLKDHGKSQQLISETDEKFGGESMDSGSDEDTSGNDVDFSVTEYSSSSEEEEDDDDEFTLNKTPKKKKKKRGPKVTHQDKPRKCLFECRHCKEQFPFRRELRDHLFVVHNEDFRSTCKHCSLDFKTQCEQQQNSSSGENMSELPLLYRCRLNGCNRLYKTISQLRAHHHPKCPESPKVQRKLGQSFQCDQCGKVYQEQTNLRYHIASVHEKSFKFCCEICGDGFQIPSALKEHMRKHSTERTFECQVCKKTFKRGQALFYHRRVHTGEVPYTCEICGKGFQRPCKMKRHIEGVHGSEIHPCEICGKKFRSTYYVYNHVMTYHRGLWKKDKTTATTQEDESRNDGMMKPVLVAGGREEENTENFDRNSSVHYHSM